jgi:hypothetical protein
MSRTGERAAAPAAVLAIALAAVLPSQAAAADLPRVFLSPAERAALTSSRLAGRPQSSLPEPAATLATPGSRPMDPAAPPSTATTPRAARVEGVTFGAGRSPAVWIGGERIADGGYWSGHRVRVMQDGVQLVSRDGQVRRLRVGMEARP